MFIGREVLKARYLAFVSVATILSQLGPARSQLPNLPLPNLPLPQLPPCSGDICGGIDKALKGGVDTVKKGAEAIGALATAVVTDVRKVGDNAIETVTIAGGNVTATYVKAWRDVGSQATQAFKDAVDAGQATLNFVGNQARTPEAVLKSNERRLRDGKVIDAIWGTATEPLQATERNFAQATKESELINQAASSAAAIYGGPGGAAAYASWSTYQRTGDADMAFRAGVLSGLSAQTGKLTAMPSGTSGEVVKKAVIAGAAGGIAVEAAGGDQQAIENAFLKSAGGVVVQSGSAKLNAYLPQLNETVDAAQCISARDIDCISNSRWVRDVKGRIVFDKAGKSRLDSSKFDPAKSIVRWTGIDPNSVDGQRIAKRLGISKLPDSEIIPLLNNEWVLTSKLGPGQKADDRQPTVVLSYVGTNAPFISSAVYRTSSGGVVSQTVHTCPVNGYRRTITLETRANSCLSIYRKEGGGSQVIWRSNHKAGICTGKTAAFIQHMAGLGIHCKIL